MAVNDKPLTRVALLAQLEATPTEFVWTHNTAGHDGDNRQAK